MNPSNPSNESNESSGRPFRAWLFDLDGTLIDSIDLIWRSYHHAIRVHFGREAMQDEWKPGLGRPLRWQFSQITNDDDEITALVKTYRVFNDEWHDRLVQVYAGVPELLARVRSAGGRIGIVTSKTNAGARRGLAICGLADAVDVIVGVDDVERAKPHPEPVERALGLLGIAARDAIMIGDSPHDIRSGRDAGTFTCGALWGPFREDEFAECVPDRFARRPADVG